MSGTSEPLLTYPSARRDAVVDDYFGTRVADPYRWLENTDSAETRAWIEAENRLTFSFLEAIPERSRIKARLEKLWDFERYGAPLVYGGRYFYFHNTGLQNQSVLLIAPSLEAPPTVLIDPNTLSADGTVALTGMSIADDGTKVAYGLASAGSDWTIWRVRDVATGKDLPDELRWIKWSAASWKKDGSGFFYSRFPEPAAGADLREQNYYQKLYFHRLGTPQSADVLIYERPDEKEWGFSGVVSDDGRYLVISVTRSTSPENLVYYKDLEHDGPIVPLVSRWEAEYGFIGNGTGADAPVFWFKTSKDAPRRRIVAIDTRRPDPVAWREIVPQAPALLETVSWVGGRLVASYLEDAHSAVRLYSPSGELVHQLDLGALGTAAGFYGRQGDRETFYTFDTFVAPPTVYRLDLSTLTQTVWRRPRVDFDPAQYATEQVFYRSKDGTRVPMFLSYRKGLARNGANPTYLYGYGGFDISLTPSFSVGAQVWMEMGGLYAVANLRGGGEYGEEWHLAGTKANKQNVFDDFIGAAEWLIAERYTSTPELAIGGASNGGLLIGACLTQRPDLFGAALPDVGVLDMLRFQKFTIGWAWTDDYGSSDDAAAFRWLYAYSPYHNVRPGTVYPATLITTGDHDDRVVPGHSFKFAAALQAAQAGPAPILIRIQTKAGHGAGKPLSKVLDQTADRWAFLVRVLHLKLPASF